MNQGLQNTVVGVALAALLSGVGVVISQGVDHGEHLAKIDTVLSNQAIMMSELKTAGNTVPPIVETKLEEIRGRLNLQEQRINNVESKK